MINLTDYATDLVAHLEGDWSIEMIYGDDTLLHSADGGLILRLEGQRLAVLAVSMAPQHFTGERAPRITIDVRRPLATVARDIARRLVPLARAWWEAERVAQLAHEAAGAHMDALVKRFIDADIGLTVRSGAPGYQQTLSAGFHGCWLELRVNAETVDIRALGVPIEGALAMLEGLRAATEQAPAGG